MEVSPYSDYANLLLAAFGTFWRNGFFNTDLNALEIFGTPEMLVCNGM